MDALQLYISIAGLAYFFLSNNHTLSQVFDRDLAAPAAREATLGLGLDVRPFDADAACATGALRETTRDAGLSLGDRACLALARQLGRPVLTADRSWTRPRLGLTVRLVR